MAIPTPRRLSTTRAGTFGPLAVDRHEVDVGGAHHTYYTLRLADWAVVVAIDGDGRFVLVRQHRQGVDRLTLEVPGGIIDPGEAPEAAAARELREETGYVAGTLEPLGWVHPNPVLQDNRCYLFIARGVRSPDDGAPGRLTAPCAPTPRAPPVTDERERIEPVLMETDAVAAAIRDGRITHALSVLALERARSVRAAEPALLRRILDLLDAMEDVQRRKVVDLARRIRPHLTAEDLRNPHDFPDLDDPDWQFEDGQLAAIQSVRFALHALPRDVPLDGEADEGRSQGEGAPPGRQGRSG